MIGFIMKSKLVLLFLLFSFSLLQLPAEKLIVERKGDNAIRALVSDTIPDAYRWYYSLSAKSDKINKITSYKCKGVGGNKLNIYSGKIGLFISVLPANYTYDMLKYSEAEVIKGNYKGEAQFDFQYQGVDYKRSVEWKARRNMKKFKATVEITLAKSEETVGGSGNTKNSQVTENEFIKKYINFENHCLYPKKAGFFTLLYAINNDGIFAVSNELILREKKTGTILFNLNNNKEIKLELPDFPDDSRFTISGFALNDNIAILSTNKRLYFYNVQDDFKFLRLIEIGREFNNLKIIDDIVFLYEAQIVSATRSFTNVWVYDLSSNTVVQKYEIDEKPDYFFYNYTPRRILDVNEQFIVHSDIVNYNIDVYNTNNKYLYSIDKTPETWQNTHDMNILKESLRKAKELMDNGQIEEAHALVGALTSDYCDIVKIFLSGNQLYVIHRNPLREGEIINDAYIDVYELGKDGYKIKDSNLMISNFAGASEINPQKLNIAGETVEIVENKFICLTLNPFPLSKAQKMTKEEYESKRMEYLMGNDMRLSIFFYELKND